MEVQMINGSGTEELRNQSNQMEQIRAKALSEMEDLLENGKAKLNDLGDRIGNEVSTTKNRAETQIKEKPLQYVVGASIGGLVLGYLLGKKR